MQTLQRALAAGYRQHLRSGHCYCACLLQIRQVSAQVHDIRGRVGHLVKLLQSKGFEVQVYQEPRFADCNLHMVYAARDPHH